jgi:alpha-L-arabinofuranosidase
VNGVDVLSRAILNLDIEGPALSRHLYGHFAEHLGRCVHKGFCVGEDSEIPHDQGIRLDVVEALKALAVRERRIPAGDRDRPAGRAVRSGEARILHAERLQALNTFDQPAAVVPAPFDGVSRAGDTVRVELPAHSFVTVQLPTPAAG